MFRRLPTLLVGVCLFATAAPFALGVERHAGPAPVDLMFVDPVAVGPFPRLPFGGDPGADLSAQELKTLPFAAPAYAAGVTDTLLRATGMIPDAQYNVGLRVALDRDQVPNPVVAGYYYNPTSGEHYNGVLVKFNGQGEMAYNAGIHFGDFEVLYGAAVDGSGNAFGGGYAFDAAAGTYKFLAAKVDSAGSVLWQRMVAADPGAIYSIGSDVAVDASGNAIVAGLAIGNTFNYDAGVVKFDPAGNVLFAKRINLPATQEYILGAAVDGSGNILLGGIDFSSGQYLPLVMKLDPNGNVLARTTINVPNAIAYGIAAGDDGSVALGGYRFDSAGPQLGPLTRAFAARLNPDLSLDWAQGIIAGVYTVGLDVGMDDAGNVVLGGYAFTGQLVGTQYDVFVAKLAAAGPTLFTRLIDRDPSMGTTFEIAYGAAVSPDGLFIATGGYALVDNTYGIFSTKSLGASLPGAVSGALNTAVNAQAIAV